ncbi:MAG: phosphotransferase [Propionibacteriales bacterium]|nr:phosphotransferase [Propionibacteriales bacterium]
MDPSLRGTTPPPPRSDLSVQHERKDVPWTLTTPRVGVRGPKRLYRLRPPGWVATVDDFDNGWDAKAVLVDGRWVDRMPRRPEVEAPLRRETGLLPWLAPQLPLPVPEPVVVSHIPLRVRHRLIEGLPCPGVTAEQGQAVGAFLRVLHDVTVSDARSIGVPDKQLGDTWPRFEHEVLPMIAAAERGLVEPATQLLERCAHAPKAALVHGDFGPDHIRVQGGVVSGIIDWTDACIGDPALDLAWVLYGTQPAFAEAIKAAYGVDEELVCRARDWRLLGPWHEVTYGLDLNDPGYVRSGMAGVVDRLRTKC